jgi:hypothetical protein
MIRIITYTTITIGTFWYSQVSAQTADWSSCAQYGNFKWAGIAFSNQRWNGETGCIYVDTGKTITFWTTHNNFQACCSSPYVGIGCVGNGVVNATNSSLPVKLKDIEICKINRRFTVPMPVNPGYSTQAYHIYYELFFGSSATGSCQGAGNIAIVLWDVAFYHQPNQTSAYGQRVTVGNMTMDVKYNGANPNGQGPFWVMCLKGDSLKPDANGTITVRDLDIKACIDWCIAQGTYTGDEYLREFSAAYEVMTLRGGTLRNDDMSFLVKATGKTAVLTPTWANDNWGSTSNIGDDIKPNPRLKKVLANINADGIQWYDVRGRTSQPIGTRLSSAGWGVKLVVDSRTKTLMKKIEINTK